jgi:hypothetical protein
MRFELRLARECTVCLQSDGRPARVEAALFGAKPFALCPSCGRLADPSNAAYRVRARQYLGVLTYVADDPVEEEE